MVSRVVVYPGQVPLETDLLQTSLFNMVGLGNALAAVLGTGTLVDGLSCAATTVPSLAVQVGPGAIYSLQNIDGTAYSSLPADTAHQTVKQGLLADAVTLATPAPATAGQSVVYLVQAAYADQDANPVVLPYYNASNPTQAYSGPANTGVAQNTLRKGVCLVGTKAGVAGVSPTAPAPDAGYVGLYTVTVANGQSTVTAPNIALLASAPFIAEKLTAKLSKATADTYYGPQHGQCRLTLSGGAPTLTPYNGNRLVVNGAMATVPAGGVALSATTSASTVYYVYASVNGSGVLTIEASATTHAPGTNGVEIKAGDPTRTLVGMARTTAANAWADSATQRFTLSWFNRRALPLVTPQYSTNTTSTSTVEVTAAARLEFLTWGDEGVQLGYSGQFLHNTNGGVTNGYILLDGAQVGSGQSTQFVNAGWAAAAGINYATAASEGYHYASVGGSTTYAGTAQFVVSTTAAVRG